MQTEWKVCPMYYVSRVVLHFYSFEGCVSFSYIYRTYVNLKEYKLSINVITHVSSQIKNSTEITYN